MTKQNKTSKRVKANTKGVQVRLRKTTIQWIADNKVDDDTPSVPAHIRKTIEEQRKAEEKKSD